MTILTKESYLSAEHTHIMWPSLQKICHSLVEAYGHHYIPHASHYLSSVLVVPVEGAPSGSPCRVCKNTAIAKERKEAI
jgi:hypothetical protein